VGLDYLNFIRLYSSVPETLIEVSFKVKKGCLPHEEGIVMIGEYSARRTRIILGVNLLT